MTESRELDSRVHVLINHYDFKKETHTHTIYPECVVIKLNEKLLEIVNVVSFLISNMKSHVCREELTQQAYP